jgi:antitoxin component YwqK of YwqJK toxin-antitoxin module
MTSREDLMNSISKTPKEMQLQIVKDNGLAIKFFKDADSDVQLAAVKQNPDALQYIENPCQEVLDLPITLKKGEDVPKSLIEKGKRHVVWKWENGNTYKECWYVDGELHNESGPAYILYYESGQKEEYYVNGELHNESGPAYILYYKSGEKEIVKYYIKGKLHNENGPAMIWYYESGQKKSEKYYIDNKEVKKEEVVKENTITLKMDEDVPKSLIEKGKRHVVWKRPNGNTHKECWFVDGELHNESGPAFIMYYKNGKKNIEKYLVKGKLHNEKGPAFIMYCKNGQGELEDVPKSLIEKGKRHVVWKLPNGNTYKECWFVDGELHNESGPALILYYDSGKKNIEKYLVKGKLHNEKGPAFIMYYKNGQKEFEEYYINGKLHNENGPAMIWYYESGQKKSEKYYIDCKLHNEKGPALIMYYKNGQKEFEEYYINGKLHNENGPAMIGYYESGQKESENYYIDGKWVDKTQFKLHSDSTMELIRNKVLVADIFPKQIQLENIDESHKSVANAVSLLQTGKLLHTDFTPKEFEDLCNTFQKLKK